MKVYRMTRKQLLPISLEEAWLFFADASNLENLTPPTGNANEKDWKDAIRSVSWHDFDLSSASASLHIPLHWVTELT